MLSIINQIKENSKFSTSTHGLDKNVLRDLKLINNKNPLAMILPFFFFFYRISLNVIHAKSSLDLFEFGFKKY